METLNPNLDEAAIQHLRASLRGTIVRPGGDDYEAARRIWNGMIDRKATRERPPGRGQRTKRFCHEGKKLRESCTEQDCL